MRTCQDFPLDLHGAIPCRNPAKTGYLPAPHNP